MLDKFIISKRYYIKPDGNVYRIKDDSIHYPKPNKNGYIYMKINHKSYRLHRLIAEAFIPNPDNLPEVDHINRNKLDNRVENLRWVTVKENANNRKIHSKNPKAKEHTEYMLNYYKEHPEQYEKVKQRLKKYRKRHKC